MDNNSVMDYNPNQVSFTSSLQQEYNEAKEKGFNGTYEEFLAVRDYT